MSEKKIFEEMSKSALIIFSGVVFGSVFNYIALVLMGRFYGPVNYGLIALGWAAVGFATIVSRFGIEKSAARWISNSTGNKKKIKSITISAFKVSLPISILTASFILFFSEELSVVLREPGLPPIVRILALSVPFMVTMSIFVSIIRGMQNTKYKVYTENVVRPLVKALLIAAAVLLGLSIESVAWFHVLSIIVATFFSFYFFEKLLPWSKIEAEGFSSKKLMTFSWPLMVSSVLVFTLNWIDTFMVSYFQTAEEVGVYNAAYPTASILVFAYSSFAYLLMPKASELYSKKKWDKLEGLYKTIARWIAILNLPILIFILIFSRSIIILLFGTDFSGGWLALSVLAAGYFIKSLGGLSGRILLSIGKTKTYMVIFAIITILNVALNLFLIPVYGFTGAAIALTVSYSVGWSVSVYIVKRKISYPLSIKIMGPAVVAILFSVPLIFFQGFVTMNIFSLSLSGFIYASSYIYILIRFNFLEEEERESIRFLLGAISQRFRAALRR